jgi:hypothetical protein
MPVQVSPTLLTTYLAAAGRQALSHEELTERSRWAAIQARYQLEATRDVLLGTEDFVELGVGAGFHQIYDAENPELAELVLTDTSEAEQGDAEDREKAAAQQLDVVIGALKVLSESDEPQQLEKAGNLLTRVFGSAAPAAA